MKLKGGRNITPRNEALIKSPGNTGDIIKATGEVAELNPVKGIVIPTSTQKKKRTTPQKPKFDSKVVDMLLDEFEQLKTYFRKGNRPSQKKAIENFEKHLKELKK